MLNTPIINLLQKAEEYINAITPEIPLIPEISIEEEWRHLQQREANTKISIIDSSIIEIRFNCEAIASIVCDRLTVGGNPFRAWGVKEIHFLFKEQKVKVIFD
jgi:hypothetical protein